MYRSRNASSTYTVQVPAIEDNIIYHWKHSQDQRSHRQMKSWSTQNRMYISPQIAWTRLRWTELEHAVCICLFLFFSFRPFVQGITTHGLFLLPKDLSISDWLVVMLLSYMHSVLKNDVHMRHFFNFLNIFQAHKGQQWTGHVNVQRKIF